MPLNLAAISRDALHRQRQVATGMSVVVTSILQSYIICTIGMCCQQVMAETNNNVQSVLDRVSATVTECGRKLAENQDIRNAVRELNACKVNLHRISERIATNTLQTIEGAIDSLLQLSSVQMESQHGVDTNVEVGLELLPSAQEPLQLQGIAVTLF